MLNSKSVGIALAAALALIAAYVLLQALEESRNTLSVTVDSTAIVPPGIVRGVANTQPEGEVEVRAEVDGLPIEGFPDVDMEGSVNVFEIHTTPAMSGKTIVVTATAADGTEKRTYIEVH